MKITVTYGDGTTEEVTKEQGFIVCWWADEENREIRYCDDGLEHPEILRMLGVLIDSLADTWQERQLPEDEQLFLDQHRAVEAATKVLD